MTKQKNNELYLQTSTKYEQIYCILKLEEECESEKEVLMIETGCVCEYYEGTELLEGGFYFLDKSQVKETIEFLNKIYDKME